MISLEEFKRIDLRAGEVVAAEPVPASNRLLQLTVDLGRERRTLVGGLAPSHEPDELRGLKVVVVANLAPARIRAHAVHRRSEGSGAAGDRNDGADVAEGIRSRSTL